MVLFCHFYVRQVSKDILNRRQDGEIEFSHDYRDLLGNLEFKPEDYD